MLFAVIVAAIAIPIVMMVVALASSLKEYGNGQKGAILNEYAAKHVFIKIFLALVADVHNYLGAALFPFALAHLVAAV